MTERRKKEEESGKENRKFVLFSKSLIYISTSISHFWSGSYI